MAQRGIDRALRRTDSREPRQASLALGVLFLCGAALTFLGLTLSGWEPTTEAGAYGIGIAALVVGAASVIWSRHARPWTVHAQFAAGTSLICLGVFVAGVATGAYSVLFVWLAVLAASFFSVRAVAAQVAWILIASAVTLALVERSPGISAATRWLFGSLLIVIAAAVVGQIAAGRRSVEQRLREEIEEKARLQRELEHLADHDPLTGLANRRRFEHELRRELERGDREATPLALVALDLNEFKEYNDMHGHVAGDRMLKQLASAWTAVIRAPDLLARIGGDEFVVLLPSCASDQTQPIVDRLCELVPRGLSCSAGTAGWDGVESADELLTRADQAMYATKRGQATTVEAIAEA